MSMLEKKMKVLEFILCLFRKKTRMSPEKFITTPIKTIVIINNKRLGDFLFCTPAIRILKENNPSSKIVVVTSKQNSGLIGETKFIDEVFFMENKFIDAVNIGIKIRRLHPELGIIFHSKSPYDLIALTITGVSCLLKHFFGNEKKAFLNVCDGYVLGGVMPPVINDIELVKKLGFISQTSEMFFPSKISIKQTGRLQIGIQLGASGKDRFFPVTAAREVIYTLQSNYPEIEFFLFGVKQEIPLGNELTEMLDTESRNNTFNLMGKTTIKELAEQINNMTVLITPDTGCLHIATALKTKTVSLFVQRQTNASVPQQDPDKHIVLYASDYLQEKLMLNDRSKIAAIPANEIVKSVTTLISE
ncbi:glycosyltransferase family 9 protein [Enterobacteriaceae bacterium H18W14]|uniref:glycosyltransferase family 9 protein n=1 Tax=Dryocola boscaweniae TaxID=2925397 RepID=UPI0022EFDFCC|nr:glycosyltransferase family 9 protein [Dryocola boscaweniae]MCT4716760.1 glycosyltransferase family 9 protein [Dryocola boscaweniae]